MNTIGKNIKRLREQAGYSQEQLAERLGKTRAAISQYESGWTTPRMGVIENMAALFGVSKSEIIESAGKGLDSFTDIPYYGRIAAGTPIEMEGFEDSYPVRNSIKREHERLFWLKVEGDSVNRLIPNGYLACIDPDMTEGNEHDLFAVCVNGQDATLKHVRRLANGIELVPDSWDVTYRAVTFDFGEEDTPDVTIIGKVVSATMPDDYEI